MEDKIDQNESKEKRSRAARSLKHINLEQLNKKLLTSLNRTADDLLDRSYGKTMDKDDLNALINCLKLMPNLIKQEKDDMENMSQEDLEAMAKEDVESE